MESRFSHTQLALLTGVLYFFCNSVLLPEGLLYTTLLTPFFLLYLYRKGALRPLGWFFVATVPFAVLHFAGGVATGYYLRSWALFFSACVFALAFRRYLLDTPAPEKLYHTLLVLNGCMVALALATVAIPRLRPVFWYLKEFSPGTGSFPRLKLLGYEASYYGLLLAPLAIYYYLKLWRGLGGKRPWLVFLLVTLPLALTMSLGVLAATVLALALTAALFPRVFLRKKKVMRLIGLLVLLSAVAGLLLWVVAPGNALAGRLENIFTGRDTSFRGRTYEAFVLAWKIVREKSVWFGCGPGQTKLVGVEVFQRYYGYLPPVVRIPNTLADTLATYGLAGLFLRLAATVFLFFRTRVSGNYYRLALFLFIFIYQFTGSFMTNIAEYVIWVLAFTPVFPVFDRDTDRARPSAHRRTAPVRDAGPVRIAILGTRGIPNRYGGFEQFASFIAPMLVARGYAVTVYNPSGHGYRAAQWKGVEIVTRYDPRRLLGAAGQFVYDALCIAHARRARYGVVLQLGYTTSSVWHRWWPRDALRVTHMDGLEWKRDKYGKTARRFVKAAEKMAVQASDLLVADSRAVGRYLRDAYGKEAIYIPYGAALFSGGDPSVPRTHGLEPLAYDLMIARPEPENSPEEIIGGWLDAGCDGILAVIGRYGNAYGKSLRRRYRDPRVRFLGGIYDMETLNHLRRYCRLYFHGHSVGGTNPSLLEAMATGCMIVAHDNPFNREVLGEDACYFAGRHAVAQWVSHPPDATVRECCSAGNRSKIESRYHWQAVLESIENELLLPYAHRC